MKYVTKTTMSAAVGIVAISLTACGGSSGGSKDQKTGTTSTSSTASAAPTASASTAPRQPVPAAFDNTKGWSVTAPAGVVDPMGDPVIAPDNALLLLRSIDVNHHTKIIMAYDAKTGAVRWSSKPADPFQPGGLVTSFLVMHKDGKEYAVLASNGVTGGDGVNNGTQVTQLAVYDAASSGNQVAPLRTITVPGAADGFSVLRDGGTILVHQSSGGAVVDVTNSQITTYGAKDALLNPPAACSTQNNNNCGNGGHIIGLTADGPLVTGDSEFWSKDWAGTDNVPPGAKAQFFFGKVDINETQGGQAVVQWPRLDNPNPIWAVHDGKTGKVLANVPCAMDPHDSAVTLSTDGRYVIAGGGLVVFDLKTNKGHCFEATDARKTIDVTAVDTDGTAYGTAVENSDKEPASVSLDTDEAVALPQGAVTPDLVGAGVGVFGTSTAGGETILVYPHR